MTRSIRFHATGLLLSAALLGVLITWPACWDAPGIDWATDRSPGTEVVVEPSQEVAALARRIEAKLRVVGWLRAGEVTLFEAAAWFRLLDEESPAFPAHGANNFPGGAEEEKLCHQTIVWVESQKCGGTSDGEIDQTIARLEGELLAHLAEHGRVYLPAWR